MLPSEPEMQFLFGCSPEPMYYLTQGKKGISSIELARRLGVSKMLFGKSPDALQFGCGQIINQWCVVPGQLSQLVEPTEHDLDTLERHARIGAIRAQNTALVAEDKVVVGTCQRF
jgi:hypothetical protein